MFGREPPMHLIKEQCCFVFDLYRLFRLVTIDSFLC